MTLFLILLITVAVIFGISAAFKIALLSAALFIGLPILAVLCLIAGTIYTLS